MSSEQPGIIVPHKFYSMEEAIALLKERAKIESLRPHGLVSPGKDDLGQVILDEYVRYCATIVAERGPGSSKGEGHESLFDKSVEGENPPFRNPLSSYLAFAARFLQGLFLWTRYSSGGNDCRPATLNHLKATKEILDCSRRGWKQGAFDSAATAPIARNGGIEGSLQTRRRGGFTRFPRGQLWRGGQASSRRNGGQLW